MDDLIRQWKPLALGLARRYWSSLSMGKKCSLDDLISYALEGLWHGLKTFRARQEGLSLGTYLTQRIRWRMGNAVRDLAPLRSDGGNRRYEDVQLSQLNTGRLQNALEARVSTDPSFARVDHVDEVDACLRRYPPRTAMILRLRFLEELTSREIGLRIGLVESRVRMILLETL